MAPLSLLFVVKNLVTLYRIFVTDYMAESYKSPNGPVSVAPGWRRPSLSDRRKNRPRRLQPELWREGQGAGNMPPFDHKKGGPNGPLQSLERFKL